MESVLLLEPPGGQRHIFMRPASGQRFLLGFHPPLASAVSPFCRAHPEKRGWGQCRAALTRATFCCLQGSWKLEIQHLWWPCYKLGFLNYRRVLVQTKTGQKSLNKSFHRMYAMYETAPQVLKGLPNTIRE